MSTCRCRQTAIIPPLRQGPPLACRGASRCSARSKARRTAPGRRSAGSWVSGFGRPRHQVAVSHRRYQTGREQSYVRSAPLAVARRLAGRAATGQGLSARFIGPRRQHPHAWRGCATVPSPEQSGGSRWVVSTEKWRWWRVPAAGSVAGLAREGAAVVCADIDGAAPETAVAQIPAIGGRPTGIARPPFRQPPRRNTTAAFRVSRVLAVAVNRVAQIQR